MRTDPAIPSAALIAIIAKQLKRGWIPLTLNVRKELASFPVKRPKLMPVTVDVVDGQELWVGFTATGTLIAICRIHSRLFDFVRAFYASAIRCASFFVVCPVPRLVTVVALAPAIPHLIVRYGERRLILCFATSFANSHVAWLLIV